ncbi:MAG: LacI family DNA-binding transcriptional regulator [Acidimicrobiia bacterium]
MAEKAHSSGSVTIFDVAAAAGVSTATVSRVANGHPNIKPTTRKRVQDAMDELGYVANLRARGLAGGKTNVIGLLVDDLDSSYIAQVAKGVDRAVSIRGFDVMLATMHMRTQRSQYVHSLFNGIVDGLIVLLASGFEPYLGEVAARDFPVVLIDHAPTTRAPVVKAANTEGTTSAIEHLVGLGHRRIGFVTGFLDVDSAKKRLDAYRSCLVQLDIDVEDELIHHGDFLADSGRKAAREFLSLAEPPTAILASSDTEAFGVVQVARELGVDIPGDLSVVGFDDIPEAEYMNPGLTTVRQPMSDMGRMASELLMDAMSGHPLPNATVELPTELIIRGTTGPART